MRIPQLNWHLILILVFVTLFLIWLARPHTDVGPLIFLPRRPGI
jgi:hypothetical protein